MVGIGPVVVVGGGVVAILFLGLNFKIKTNNNAKINEILVTIRTTLIFKGMWDYKYVDFFWGH